MYRLKMAQLPRGEQEVFRTDWKSRAAAQFPCFWFHTHGETGMPHTGYDYVPQRVAPSTAGCYCPLPIPIGVNALTPS